MGVKLGNGWYSQEQLNRPGFGPPYPGPSRLIFTLTITFENGEQMNIVSDETWTGREGSIKHDSVYHGEIYDSRSVRLNWSQSGFNDSLSVWIPVEQMPSPLNSSSVGVFVLQDMPPIRAGIDALHFEVSIDDQYKNYLNPKDIGEIRGAKLTDGAVLQPIASWKSASGVATFDLGQNIAGWCRFTYRGPSGYGTYMRYSEVLTQATVSTHTATRNIYTEHLRTVSASDTYILYGDPSREYYEPTYDDYIYFLCSTVYF